MASQFTVNYARDKDQLLNKIKNAIGSKGTLNGNDQQGSFEGSSPLGTIAGNYSIDGDTITVTITDKPFLVSTGMIQSEFEKALKNA